jgi:hypothetical protein
MAATRPLRFAEDILADLAGGGLGERTEVDRDRCLEASQVCSTEVDDLAFVRTRTGDQGDERLRALPPGVVGDRDDRALQDGWVSAEGVLDLDRRDVLPASDEDVILPPATSASLRAAPDQTSPHRPDSLDPERRAMAELPSANADEIEKIRQIAGTESEAPLFMLNLNKYRPEARYPTGRLYHEYMAVLDTLLGEVGGRILWQTAVLGQVVGDQALDEAIGIWYPSHRAFVNLMRAPASRENMRLRALAVEHADLHRCQSY